ncbi:MAG: hypothetical protein JWN70_3296 [Planctomycetaceae bacterium]|nr:hypothetical protein [Planctomycetaceae bacterium]
MVVDSEWTDDDDMQVHIASLTPAHPTFIGLRFLGLMRSASDRALQMVDVVTPESRSSWGDFTQAERFLDSLGEISMVTIVKGTVDAPDVVWIPLVPTTPDRWHPGLPEDVSAWITVIRRPSLGGWRVHHLGDEVEDCPRERGSTATGKHDSR